MLKTIKIIGSFLLSVITSTLLLSTALYVVAVYERKYQKDAYTRQRFIYVEYTELIVYALLFMGTTAIVYYIIALFLQGKVKPVIMLFAGGISAILVMLAFKFTSFGYPVFQLVELVELIGVFIGGLIIAWFRSQILGNNARTA